MTAPRWFFRFMYDRESAAWQRRRDQPEQRELVSRIAGELASVVAPPGPVADLGCGPGAHALALAQRGYDVTGVDGSPRMVQIARTRAARDKAGVTFGVHDVSAPLRIATRRWEVSWRSSSSSTCRIPRPSSPRSGAACGRAGTC